MRSGLVRLEEDPLLSSTPRPSDLLASYLPYKTCSQFTPENLKLYPLSTKPILRVEVRG
ncbi:hypothetical protein ZMO1_ZMOp32x019 (plasmid) [Zymomonas mobilis subsp. mobilis ZM4 = ATCC 31821]|nr:hypothetical protein ZMO2_ZMOp32x019 [Zymomonas mobilis subsp. mobilis]AVZ28695.1 hypothetical protein ZMO3_ZMOp32x019 [Zymomonas mobilis subsp. mobilis]AVZ43141.1 hypothetical protein ZMO1_ZMOp32x019 [Zymomonas mobilis subsp. mobilis ZM4 = ATCC 31821]